MQWSLRNVLLDLRVLSHENETKNEEKIKIDV